MKQKVRSVGNSAAVLLPKPLLEEGNIRIGTTVDISYKADIGGYFIRLPDKKKKTSPQSKEFNVWLKQFMAENGEILDELATR